MIRPDDRFDPGRRPNEPIDPDKLDTEGPLATKWGYVDGTAYQRSFFLWIGSWIVRLVLGPYVLVLRSRLSRAWKVVAFVVLGSLYALLWALLTLDLPTRSG